MTLPSPPPPKGSLYLFDSVTPPLPDGSYSVTVTTDVPASGVSPTFQQERFFDVVGPRFNVPQSMVAACFPPRNGHGVYQNMLPQIVLSRRTLPWERLLVPPGAPPLGTANPRPATVAGDAAPLPAGATVPWVALLLFEEGEYTLLRNLPLEQIVPAPVFKSLGAPAGVTCDAVEAPASLIAAIMPSRQELQLLAHLRWVNVEDRELAVAGGDGFFAVVVSNRLPSPGAGCRAVLVSLEGRSDVVQENPPAVATNTIVGQVATDATTTAAALAGPAAAAVPPPADLVQSLAGIVHPAAVAARAAVVSTQPAAANTAPVVDTILTPVVTPVVDPLPGEVAAQPVIGIFQPVLGTPVALPPVRLVALTSWQFTCEGTGTFQLLMQGLAHDNALFGTVAGAGPPALTDTGHLPMALQDRAGEVEQVLYRGPLVQYPLTRDPLGPYHSADQARRVSPEAGAEDISYAAAFEVGRLLAAADGQCAKALMQWRREAYRQSARASTVARVAALAATPLPATAAEMLHTPLAPLFAATAAAAVVNSKPPIADAYGLKTVATAPGLDASALAAAWNLAAPAQATALAGGDPGSLGAVVETPALTPRPATTLAVAVADTAGLARLAAARTAVVQRATTTGDA